MEAKKQSNETKKSLRREILKQMITLSTASFGVVAALAWNNVIQEFVTMYIKPYLPFGMGIISLLIYAILITILAVLVTYLFTKLIKEQE